MGMYDTIELRGCDSVVCASGHPMLDVQTKDLGETMSTYVLWNKTLYIAHAGFALEPRARTGIVEEYVELDGYLQIRAVRTLDRARSVTGNAIVYDHCNECMPVLQEGQGGIGGKINEHYPWIEYSLEFESGLLVECKPIQIETRESLHKKWPDAIPDTDMIAQRHFTRIQRRREGKGT